MPNDKKLKPIERTTPKKFVVNTKPMNPFARENATVTAFKKGTSSALRPINGKSNSSYIKPKPAPASVPAVTIAQNQKPAQLTRKDANKQIQQQNLQFKIDKNKKQKEDKLNKEKKKFNTAAVITTGSALLGLASQTKSLFKKD